MEKESNLKEVVIAGRTVMIPIGYGLIKTELADALIKDSISPHVHIEEMKAGQQNTEDWLAGLAEQNRYESAVRNMLESHITITKTAVEDAAAANLERWDFVQALEPSYKAIYEKSGEEVHNIVNDLYLEGKEKGFEETAIEKFFTLADFQALQFTREYNFELIKNMSDDLRQTIGGEVFAAKLRGDSMPQLAKRIEALGIEPIRAGGRMLTIEERAMLIARTETARAAMQGNVIALQQLGVDLFDWQDTGGDERECDECEELAANGPYKIDELPEYPAHPDCRCRISPASVMAGEVRDGEPGTDNGPIDPTDILNLVTGETEAVDASKIIDAGMDLENLSEEALGAMDEKDIAESMQQAESALVRKEERQFGMQRVNSDVGKRQYQYAMETQMPENTIKGAILDEDGYLVQAAAGGPDKINNDILAREFIYGRGKTYEIIQPKDWATADFRNTAFEGVEAEAQIRAAVPEMISYDARGDTFYLTVGDGTGKDLVEMGAQARMDLGAEVNQKYKELADILVKNIRREIDTSDLEDVVAKNVEAMAQWRERSPDLWRQIADTFENIEYHSIKRFSWEEVRLEHNAWLAEQADLQLAAHAKELREAAEQSRLPVETPRMQPPKGEVPKLYDSPIADYIEGHAAEDSLNSPVYFADNKTGSYWYAKASNMKQAENEQLGKALTDAFDNKFFTSPDKIRLESGAWVRDSSPELFEMLGDGEASGGFFNWEGDFIVSFAEDAGGSTVDDMLGGARGLIDLDDDDLILAAKDSVVKDILIENTDGHMGNYLVESLDSPTMKELINIDDSLSMGETMGNPVRNFFGDEFTQDGLAYGDIRLYDGPRELENSIKDFVDMTYGDSIDRLRENIDYKQIPLRFRNDISKRLSNIEGILGDYTLRRAQVYG